MSCSPTQLKQRILNWEGRNVRTSLILGFAPYFSDMLFASVQDSPYYALSFDESLNRSQQSGQMDINVRFWNSEKCITETGYFNTEFLGGA